MHDFVDLLKQLAGPASWLALPVGLWCAIDSWIFAPRRQIELGAHAVKDPPLVRVAYAILPWLMFAVVLRLITRSGNTCTQTGGSQAAGRAG